VYGQKRDVVGLRVPCGEGINGSDDAFEGDNVTPDDFLKIEGVGPKVAVRLDESGHEVSGIDVRPWASAPPGITVQDSRWPQAPGHSLPPR
jgi:hypothetical protein